MYKDYNFSVLINVIALINGCILLYILLAPINEFTDTGNPDPTTGMTAVGVAILLLLVAWNIYMQKMEEPKNEE